MLRFKADFHKAADGFGSTQITLSRPCFNLSNQFKRHPSGDVRILASGRTPTLFFRCNLY